MKAEPGMGDVELCFNFMYGIMMLRMKNKALVLKLPKRRQKCRSFWCCWQRTLKPFAMENWIWNSISDFRKVQFFEVPKFIYL